MTGEALRPRDRRPRRGQRARGGRPNVIAVDFYRGGDLLRAVRALNGLPPEGASAVR